jgi:hypothetical protein
MEWEEFVPKGQKAYSFLATSPARDVAKLVLATSPYYRHGDIANNVNDE